MVAVGAGNAITDAITHRNAAIYSRADAPPHGLADAITRSHGDHWAPANSDSRAHAYA